MLDLPRPLTKFDGVVPAVLRLESMMFRGRRTSSPPKTKALSGFIDEGSAIEGRYRFSGTVMVNGHFNGEIVTGDTLIVGEKGVLRATVRAGTVVVNGEITGNVQASERVELRGQARLYGDVQAPVVVVEEGVVFQGRCRMGNGADEEAGPDTVEALPVPAG
jgi:cytoskeletal protein CcmA (bactofilin family)